MATRITTTNNLKISSRQSLYLFDDFVATAASGQLSWSANIASGGAQTMIAPFDSSFLGVASLSTGATSAAGRLALTLGTFNLVLGGGPVVIEQRIRTGVLSTPAQRYVVRTGLGDNAAAGDYTDGVYFEYNEAISPNWILKTSSNNVRTQVITSVAVSGNTPYTLKTITNSAGNSTEFFIAGVSVGTISTNNPNTTGRACSPSIKLEKSVGIGAMFLYVDYYSLYKVFSPSR